MDRESASVAVETIKNAAGTVGPISEISHDLWTQYRKREGQSLDQFISRDAGGSLGAEQAGDLVASEHRTGGGGF